MACNLLDPAGMPFRKQDDGNAPRRVIRLAPGLCLRSDLERPAPMLLVSSAGNIELNQHALTILELCDGSRSRERVVMDAMLHRAGAMRGSDVREFLNAAAARGWLIEED